MPENKNVINKNIMETKLDKPMFMYFKKLRQILDNPDQLYVLFDVFFVAEQMFA